MVDFLGSYCEVPLGDDDFLEDPRGSSFQAQPHHELYADSPTSEIEGSPTQTDEEEYLSSRPASRLNRPSFQHVDISIPYQAEEEASMPKPHSLDPDISSANHESPTSIVPSSASASATDTLCAKERDFAKPLSQQAAADEEEEFNPVSVASMSMFGEAPQSMVTLQLKQTDSKTMQSRLQELSKLASANRDPQSAQASMRPENDSLFGSSPRRVVDNQSQADEKKPNSATAMRGLFRIFRRRQDSEQQEEQLGNFPSQQSNRSGRPSRRSKR